MAADGEKKSTEASVIVQIANDVIAAIASKAALDVQGVAGMSAGLAGELSERLGKKSPAKGVRIDVKDGRVMLDLFVVMHYGYRIPEVSANIQTDVKKQVETMTGLTVQAVNIHVQSLSFHTGNGSASLIATEKTESPPA
ncbi:MAG: Asp23/Gls24 family envelope stress response protein [Firmicutes bacterium]|nr:Asp23/Gls24 family envelope stress response protein [Bacillota bacterium]